MLAPVCMPNHETNFISIFFKCKLLLGTLSVTVDGPAKVSLDCTEIEDGYKAR